MAEGSESKTNTWGGYGAAAVGGAAVGAAFPLFLFDKLGIATLLTNQSTFNSIVYAITVFAMVAMIVLTTGAVLTRGQTSGNRILMTVVLGVFGAVFAVGFGYFVLAAATKPGITVNVTFDDYDKLVKDFQQFQLSPYVYAQEKRAFVPSKPHRLIVTGDAPINFGMDNLKNLEDAYSEAYAQLQSHRFDNVTMGEICRDPKYHSNQVCTTWSREGMMQ